MAEFSRESDEKAAQHALLTSIFMYQRAGCKMLDFLTLVVRFWQHPGEESVRLQHWQA